MKTQYIIYPAMIAALSTGCGNSEYKEENMEAQELSAESYEQDTMVVKRDGTLITESFEGLDSLMLPPQVISTIEKDANLSISDIVNTSSKTEDSKTIYEVEFRLQDESTKKVVFDENGDRIQEM
ncbi:hypothetical protein [Algoriphagus vanfongensis]|uniref:hypothetical protein n=1 Tax=Algoriphagus vanfongensis TaxID=426371 RepID=UPI000414F8BD|nr:hypothetical protein [Algoriphagus vanfongensis]